MRILLLALLSIIVPIGWVLIIVAAAWLIFYGPKPTHPPRSPV